jgi:hypothetical protein
MTQTKKFIDDISSDNYIQAKEDLSSALEEVIQTHLENCVKGNK